MFDKWDKRFLDLARLVGTWSSCYKDGRQMGSVIVKDKRIITTGYNGAPQGVTPCKERGECMRTKNGIESGTRAELCYAVHAEQNAIIQAARIGVSTLGATIYITHSPCSVCSKIIINSGITRVVYITEYPDKFSFELLLEAGVKVEKYDEENFLNGGDNR